MDNRSTKRIVYHGAWGLFALWCVVHFRHLMAGEEGFARVLTSAGFGIALLLDITPLRRDAATPEAGFGIAPKWMAIAAFLLYSVGRILGVHQAVWIALLLFLAAVQLWAGRPVRTRDTMRALALFYFMHPLPGNLAGPVELWMQRVSVAGAELLLHAMNVPAWADGLVLRTGSFAYEVPAACSGLKTGVVVFVCILGAMFLQKYRYHPLERLLVALAGSLQVMPLNILRIAMMVRFAGMASYEVLHDATGVFLLATIGIAQLEVYFWQRYRFYLRNRRNKRNRPAYKQALASIFRGKRMATLRWIATILMLCAVGLAVAYGVYKRRPVHRAAMHARVAEEMMQQEPLQALRLMSRVVDVMPSRPEYILQYAQTLMLANEPLQALHVLEGVPANKRDATYDVVHILANHAVGQDESALAVVAALSREGRLHPAQALLAAEIHAKRNEIEACVHLLEGVPNLSFLQSRIRRLFPFLAQHQRWDVIMRYHTLAPFNHESILQAAVHACVIQGRMIEAERLLSANLPLWQGNAAYLSVIGHIAQELDGSAFARQTFVQLFEAHYASLGWEVLLALIEIPIRLGREDLVSMACRALSGDNPDHPAVLLVLARYADDLLRYSDRLYVASMEDPAGVLSFTPPCRFLVDLLPANAGHAALLAEQRHEWLARCFSAARQLLETEPDIEVYAEIMADAARLQGDLPAALSALAGLEYENPIRQNALLFHRAGLLHDLGRFHEVYETLHALRPNGALDSDAVVHLKARSLLGMGLPFAAFELVSRILPQHSASSDLTELYAVLLDRHGYPDEALKALEAYRGQADPYLLQLLVKTGRWDVADTTRAVLGLPLSPADRRIVPLPPAERALHWVASPAQHDVQLTAMGEPADRESPFVTELANIRRTLSAALAEPNADTLLPDLHTVGRNAFEQVVAYHALITPLMEAEKIEVAREVLDAALRLSPDSPMLWRMRVAIAEGDRAIVQRARRHVPHDPELWLAHVVVSEIHAEQMPVATFERFPLETLIRAGDYYMRTGSTDEAGLLVALALQRERDPPLSLRLLAMNWAWAVGHRDESLRHAIAGAQASPVEWVFRQAAVRLRMEKGIFDLSLINDLQALVALDSNYPEWHERLGVAHFHIGRYRQALHAFRAAENIAAHTISPAIALKMAESARQVNRPHEAIDILRRARVHDPEHVALLNNLLYTMLASNAHRADAAALLPELARHHDLPDAAYDTAIRVAYSARDATLAREFIDHVLPRLDPNTNRRWHFILLNAAETAAQYDLVEDALTHYNRLISAPRQEWVSRPRVAALRELLADALDTDGITAGD